MSVEKIEISRVSRNGEWQTIRLMVFTVNNSNNMAFYAVNRPDETENEDEALLKLFCEIITQGFDLRHSKSQVIEGYNLLRENDLSGNSHDSIEILAVNYQSCKKNNDGDTTLKASEKNNVISQSEVKQKLATIIKDSKPISRRLSRILKRKVLFFENKKCSVCLSSYKEILDENLHIVVPRCGHPLCCKCADNILKSRKCPQCRGYIPSYGSFNRMKFNADLKIVTKIYQKVFL